MRSLAESGPDDCHFTLDRETGSVTFGNGEHGRRPAEGSLVEATYRCGSGRSGNRAWLALAVGGSTPSFRANSTFVIAAAPAPVSRCPTVDFTEPMTQRPGAPEQPSHKVFRL